LRQVDKASKAAFTPSRASFVSPEADKGLKLRGLISKNPTDMNCTPLVDACIVAVSHRTLRNEIKGTSGAFYRAYELLDLASILHWTTILSTSRTTARNQRSSPDENELESVVRNGRIDAKMSNGRVSQCC
jgi:hypothetical protein